MAAKDFDRPQFQGVIRQKGEQKAEFQEAGNLKRQYALNLSECQERLERYENYLRKNRNESFMTDEHALSLEAVIAQFRLAIGQLQSTANNGSSSDGVYSTQQQTSKDIKVQIILSYLLGLIGLGLLFAEPMVGIAVIAVAIIWRVVLNFRTWWEHG